MEEQPNRSPFARPNAFHRPDPRGMGTELEVSSLIAQHVRALRPRLVVETGTFHADTAVPIVLALKMNQAQLGERGAGRLITYETDPDTALIAITKLRKLPAELWELRTRTAQEANPPRGIDIAFIDSAYAARLNDVRTLAPLMSPRGLMFIHDAEMKQMQEAMERLELVANVVRYPTPRGLALVQPLGGRWEELLDV